MTEKSSYIDHPLLHPFLAPTFSPTDYLNNTLPSLSLSASSNPQPLKSTQTLTLSELANQTQTHIAQLSAQTSRLSDTLTQLTDDILRSGSRLAYEVEVLRGEAISLSEVLTDGLHDDITKFVPNGLSTVPNADGEASRATELEGSANDEHVPSDHEPSSITHLRTLHHVRAQLQSVMTTFDLALSWPLPPSVLSSSLISVAASPSANDDLETKGQAASARLRGEIQSLLDLGGAEGILAAENRIEELKDLTGVWKGTAEEKVRGRFVEGLAKMVADRRRAEEGKGNIVRREPDEKADREEKKADARATGGGPGFLKNLQRLRNEIYLE